jgi:hypothetical protein
MDRLRVPSAGAGIEAWNICDMRLVFGRDGTGRTARAGRDGARIATRRLHVGLWEAMLLGLSRERQTGRQGNKKKSKKTHGSLIPGMLEDRIIQIPCDGDNNVDANESDEAT